MPKQSYQQDLIGKANLENKVIGSDSKGDVNKLIKEAREGHFNLGVNN